MTHWERKNCRVCGNKQLDDVLSLGKQAVVDWSDRKPVVVPLDVVHCGECDLLQLRHTTDPSILWNENYGYKSGVNDTMRNHLKGIAESATREANLKPGDIVVDIGCNDGTLLGNYKGMYRVGFEPSKNVGCLSYHSGSLEKLYYDFFGSFNYVRNHGEHTAKVITAISMFYDLDDPNKFVNDVKMCLAKDGVFVVQQNYVGGMLDQNALDNICHEHLEYYSLHSMQNLLKRHNMEVYKVEKNDLNGGSFRTYICNKGERKIDSSVGALTLEEKNKGLDTRNPYNEFGDRVRANGHELREFVEKQVGDGKTVYVYGASTRGSTLMQYAGLDHRQIKAAAERNSDKWGKRYGVTGIPMISEEQARKDNPDFFLILPWFFADEFIKREAEYLSNGGHFIIPLPRLKII